MSKLNGYTKLVASFLVGLAVPGLIAWGSLHNQVKINREQIGNAVKQEAFSEYKDGVENQLESLNDNVKKILDTLLKEQK